MTPLDLLFIAVSFTSVILLARALAALAGRHRDRGISRLKWLGLGCVVYMGVVVVVSLLSPRETADLGEDQCSDDWCIAVTEIAETESGYDVMFRVSSRARRRPQRERFVVAYLLDDGGEQYDAVPDESEPPFDIRLDPGESVTTVRRYAVPPEAERIGVVISREGDYAFPRCCIIGEGPFHKRPIVYAP